MSSQLDFSILNENNVTNVELNGEVDIYTSQKLKDLLEETILSSSNIIKINCLNLKYIDSTGLGILVGAYKKAEKSNKSMQIINLRDNIKKLFIITGLDKIFKIE